MRIRVLAASLFVSFISAAQPVVVRTSTILDGKGNVLRNKDLVIDGDRISAIRDRTGRADYDLSGLTVVPGWIDTHCHPSWHFNAEGRSNSWPNTALTSIQTS